MMYLSCPETENFMPIAQACHISQTQINIPELLTLCANTLTGDYISASAPTLQIFNLHTKNFF